MTDCPKKEKKSLVSTTIKPVPEIDDVAVNIALTGVRLPSPALETGSIKRKEPIIINPK
jgi:hypothetical protein